MASFLLWWSNGLVRFPFSSRIITGMTMSSCSNCRTISSKPFTSPSKKPSPPWLMLPPAITDNRTAYKFYNLEKDSIETGFQFSTEYHDNDAVLVGSSHGWLSFFNPSRNNRLFILNPLTARQFDLPPMHTLPHPELNLRHGRAAVSKLVVSCSPHDEHDDDACRVVMSFGPNDRLAFCSLPPRHGERWTPIGGLFFKKPDPLSLAYGRAYEDFVYCARRKVFSCITEFVIDLDRWMPDELTEMEDWDLSDPVSPRSRTCHWLKLLKFEEGGNCSWLEGNKKLLQSCVQIPYLVFAEQHDQLFIVTRFVKAYETVGFCVLKVVYSGNGLVVDKLRLADTLDGLAVFVGINQSIAVRAEEFGLKPDCIYFTDAPNTRLAPSAFTYNIGIFDYGNKTFSTRDNNFTRDQSFINGVVPPPLWFTPNRSNDSEY